jgi:hypothetical protein
LVHIPNFDFSLYQKLPHPLSSLLKNLPAVDGKDVNSLCEFLLLSLRMVQVAQVKVPTIYEILYPFCKGEVLALLLQALSDGHSFDRFHEQLLKRFVPARQLSQLRVERYERVQASNEPLASYIQSVREAALVLRITETESQVLERIIEGLKPNQRARFVFQGPPNSFQQLEHLVVVDRNIAFADKTRQPAVIERKEDSVQSTTRDVDRNRVCQLPSRATHRGKVPVCYYCAKPGHVQRNCFAKQTR